MKGTITANAIHESQLTDSDPAISGTVSGDAAPGFSLRVDDSSSTIPDQEVPHSSRPFRK
ncbi:hypothetical protein N7517_007554 [Penicillium concentricum]|uniref:Uncharacterized protein n=1 Tax=Penicillium concentricum TaxID=293559 RepID=A0A9W9VB25_9EURO|nr:uncharacterized protein N7517_007554 [Penicillium concentricum]KAJ5375548.1 hypothetical protein N7517_007554 [Penicillium concentricum]